MDLVKALAIEIVDDSKTVLIGQGNEICMMSNRQKRCLSKLELQQKVKTEKHRVLFRYVRRVITIYLHPYLDFH